MPGIKFYKMLLICSLYRAGVAGGICKYQCFWSVCSHSWNEDFETSTSQPRPIAAGTVSWQNKFPTDTVNVFPVK